MRNWLILGVHEVVAYIVSNTFGYFQLDTVRHDFSIRPHVVDDQKSTGGHFGGDFNLHGE